MRAKTSGGSNLFVFSKFNQNKFIVIFPSNLVFVKYVSDIELFVLFYGTSLVCLSFQPDLYTLLMGGRSGFKFDSEDNYR